MNTKVSLAACKNYEDTNVSVAIKALLAHYGGAESLARGKRVLLKPNLLMPRAPDEATTTNPAIVAALAREFLAVGCDVVIADSCGGPYNVAVLKKLYRVTGMQAVADATGARLNFDVSSEDAVFEGGKRIGKIPIIKPVLESDFVVSIAKLKTHGLTRFTGAVKNLFGVVPGLTKPMFHSKFPEKTAFCEMIVDLCELVAPSFSVIDGVVGMQGKGPSGGLPKAAGVILGGQNPHAVDLAALRVMGFSPNDVPTVADAILRGLIPKSADDLTYTGDDPVDFEFKFLPPPGKAPGMFIKWLPKRFEAPLARWFMPYPHISPTCIGCGDCARTCPMHTIEIRDKRAHIKYDKCVKCYCCHELCPIRAISFKRNVK